MIVTTTINMGERKKSRYHLLLLSLYFIHNLSAFRVIERTLIRIALCIEFACKLQLQCMDSNHSPHSWGSCVCVDLFSAPPPTAPSPILPVSRHFVRVID